MSGESGGWYGLLAIAREARETTRAYQAMRPTHCPIDGIQLITHPRAGGLRCPFCGYQPTSQDHP